MTADTPKQPNLKQVQRYIDRMPALSTTVVKIVEVCNDPKALPSDINRVVSLDPVLAGHVLKLVNSAYYSLASPVTTLTRAIILVGVNTIKNLALSLSIIKSVGNASSFKVISVDAFWEHAIRVGVAAKVLAGARKVDARGQEEFFVGGLLHDIGKIPLNSCFPEIYAQVLDRAVEHPEGLTGAEHEILGMTHGRVGAFLAKKWALGDPLAAAMAFHHTPERAPEGFRIPIHIIALANAFANITTAPSEAVLTRDSRDALAYLKFLDLSVDTLVKHRKTINDALDSAKIFLHLTQET